jgi:lipoprotein-anchoring transpeptidase ErfK/SrfK
MSRRIGVTLAVLAVVAVVAGVAYDRARRDVIAPGVRIGGVDVGGLRVAAARRKLTEQAVRPLRRTAEVSAAGHTFLLSAREARQRVDLQAALDRALAVSRRGWFGARVVRGVTGSRTHREFALRPRVSRTRVARFASEVGDRIARKPVSADVLPHADSLSITRSHPGRKVDVVALRRAVSAALTDRARPARIAARVRPVAPKLTTAELRRRRPAYILIDRRAHQLRLYRHLRLAQTFPIAVGRAGLETPPGLYDVQWKETNPSWHVPNSAWAGALAGKTIPPGPQDPIKARWLAFNGGAGIHGIDPSEYGSIGQDASHGCVRMRIPDVIVVYDAAPVGTPVFVA